jgi:exonuclease VII large subunit
LLSVFALPVMAEDSFTQADRERLVRVEETLTTFMQQVDKRFEQVDKRFEELRTDMNARFEQMTNMFYTLSAIFTTLFAAVFGFAWWDRRSILITARKTAREEVEACTREDRNTTQMVDRLVEVLRGFAEKSPDMKELMRRVNLL